MTDRIRAIARFRPLLALGLIAALLGGVGVVAAVSATQAAWSDRSHASAVASAGTWATTPTAPAPGCTVVTTKDGKAVPGATCGIGGTSINQWSDGSSTVRDYYITVNSSVSGPGIVQKVVIDLSKIAGGGAWTWGSSVIVPSGNFTLTSSCALLPTVSATLPENQGNSPLLWVRVVEKSTMPMAASKICS